MKRCSRCGTVKQFEEFAVHNREKDGRQSWCKLCKSSQKKEKYNYLNVTSNPRKGLCLNCGKDFLLLTKNRKYCSNNCRSLWNEGSPKRKEWKSLNAEKQMLYRTRFSAKTKGIPFELQVSDIVIPDKCPILGISLERGIYKACDHSPSLDKINPALGYIPGNVRVLSQRANLLKSNATVEELRLVYEDALRLQNSELTYLRVM